LGESSYYTAEAFTQFIIYNFTGAASVNQDQIDDVLAVAVTDPTSLIHMDYFFDVVPYRDVVGVPRRVYDQGH
jgi:hypothetical protein